MIAKVDKSENLEFAKATMRVEAIEQQLDGSVTPDEYYFSFAGNPDEVVQAVRASIDQARQTFLEASRSQSNTPQNLSSTAHPQLEVDTSHQKAILQRQYSDDTDVCTSPVQTTSPSMYLDDYTYPPSVSGLPEPSSIRHSGGNAWTTWIRRQPRKVLGVPAKLPFASRLPFTYWPNSLHQQDSPANYDVNAVSGEDETDMMEEVDLVSKEKEFLKTTFGLGEREEVVYRECCRHDITVLPGLTAKVEQRCYLSRGVPIYGALYVTTSYICFKSQSMLTKTRVSYKISFHAAF